MSTFSLLKHVSRVLVRRSQAFNGPKATHNYKAIVTANDANAKTTSCDKEAKTS